MTSIYNNYRINTGFSVPKVGFKGTPNVYAPKELPIKDGYITSPLQEKYGTKAEIEAAAKTNPRVREILSEYRLPLKVNDKELEKLKNGHLQGTRITAAKIYSNLPAELKQEVNLQELQEAAMFHDYGKILIPEHILNKNRELNDEEWAIMQQHSELGAELLKDKELSPRAIELVKYHHQNKKRDGYPMISSDYEHRLDSEILSLADRYEALLEERSYKGAMTKEEALAVIEKDVKEGLIMPEVFEALKKSV